MPVTPFDLNFAGFHGAGSKSLSGRLPSKLPETVVSVLFGAQIPDPLPFLFLLHLSLQDVLKHFCKVIINAVFLVEEADKNLSSQGFGSNLFSKGQVFFQPRGAKKMSSMIES